MMHLFKTCALLILILIGTGWTTQALASDKDDAPIVMDDDYHAVKTDTEAAFSEDDDEGYGKPDDKDGRKSVASGKRTGGYSVLLPVTSKVYRQECTACHFAYLPGLLPAASWRQLLSSLDDHFGENASIEDAEVMAELSAFLETYAADKSRAQLSVRIMRDLEGKPAPKGVTDIAYIRRQHHEIPARMIRGNQKVRTLANCMACHSGAEKGVFNEDGVNIPGYGYWED